MYFDFHSTRSGTLAVSPGGYPPAGHPFGDSRPLCHHFPLGYVRPHLRVSHSRTTFWLAATHPALVGHLTSLIIVFTVALPQNFSYACFPPSFCFSSVVLCGLLTYTLGLCWLLAHSSLVTPQFVGAQVFLSFRFLSPIDSFGSIFHSPLFRSASLKSSPYALAFFY